MSTSASPSIPPALARGLPDRYHVIRHVASGGMASVWCAEDRVLGRQVAIKVLADRFASDELAVRRFKREARAAARVSAHPNVVTIFDVGDLDLGDGPHGGAGAFIVMEHLAGGTVADAIRHRAVTRDEARRWLREAAAALDHAHARGIVHRDIKPANFLLDRERGLHVADFGIAHVQSEDTITTAGELFGTAAYLSPEQALGHEATAASDVYALAVAAFELLTGGRPFTAPHFAAQARQHIEDPVPAASERERTLPPGVDAVLATGMAKAPEARPVSAIAFVDSLDAALDGEPTARTQPLVAPVPATPATAATRALSDRRTATERPAAVPLPGRGGAERRPTTQPPGRTPPARTHRRSRAMPLAALLVVAVGVAYLISQLGAGSSPPALNSARTLSTHHAATRPAARAHPKKPAAATSTSQSTTSSAPASPGPAPAGPASPAALQLLGHQQLLAGNYAQAISTLHRALAGAAPGSLTYAYALYDLGDALLRSGNPQAAIPVLQQRLKIPNQTATVQRLLDQALAAAGQSGSGGAPVHGHHGHGNGNGNGGGD